MDNSTLSGSNSYDNSTSTSTFDNSTSSTTTYDNSTSTDLTTYPFTGFYTGYEPNLILPILVSIIFLLLALYHTVLMVKRKSWYMFCFNLGIYLECVGYAFRRISASHNTNRDDGLIYFLVQSLCIILAPSLMAASFYMTFGRLITFVGESYSIIRARRITAIFVTCDVLSFLIQAGGGSLFSSDNPDVFATAKSILLIGFLIQIFSFGLFGVFAFIYQMRAKKGGEIQGDWVKCLHTLYAGCALILIRSVFRTLEFGTAANSTGYLLKHEAFYYSLETVPILLVSFLFVFSYPGSLFPVDRNARLHSSRGNDNSAYSNSMGMGTRNPNTFYDNQSFQNQSTAYLQESKSQYQQSNNYGNYGESDDAFYSQSLGQTQGNNNSTRNNYSSDAQSFKSLASDRSFRQDSRQVWGRV